MKKMKWLVLCMLVLPIGTTIKASSCVTTQKEKATIVIKAQPSSEPATLIEQILFPRGI